MVVAVSEPRTDRDPILKGTLWAAIGVNLAPSPTMHIVIQSPDAASAGTLAETRFSWGNPDPEYSSTGFGGFFLSQSSTSVYYNSGGGQPFCGEYYGTWSKDSQQGGAGKPGLAYVSLLIQ